eukprot:1074719-Amphidinium_carterae.1
MRITVDGFLACKLQTYVDDPLAVLSGTSHRRRLHAAAIILLWSALGFPRSVHKAQMGSAVSWCGFVFTIEPDKLI